MSTSVMRSEIEASPLRAGRTTGILVLLHLTLGLMVPFMMLDSVRGPRGLLLVTPDHANQLRAAVFLLFVGSAMATAISAVVFPVIRRQSSELAIWLIVLAATSFSLQVVDNGRLLTILSIGQHYREVAPVTADLYQELAFAAGAARRWSHYTYLFVAVSWIFLLFATVFRLRLVPRALAAVGMVCALMQVSAVSVRAMLGYAPAMNLAVPLGPVYLGLALWLMVKGFGEQQVSAQAQAPHAVIAR